MVEEHFRNLIQNFYDLLNHVTGVWLFDWLDWGWILRSNTPKEGFFLLKCHITPHSNTTVKNSLSLILNLTHHQLAWFITLSPTLAAATIATRTIVVLFFKLTLFAVNATTFPIVVVFVIVQSANSLIISRPT